jgi:methanogenic corrinoid protein MtbC1
MLGAYRSGMPVEELADRAIAPALVEIGTDWASGAIDIMEEHRASQMCASALYELKAVIENRAGHRRPVAVGGAVAGDPTIVPSLLAQIVLIDAGWDAVNLGPNTPFASFVRALDELNPRLVWVCVSHATDPSAIVEGCRQIYRRAEQLGVPMAVGGRALSAPMRQQMLYTTYGDGMTHLAAFARTLAPPSRPPRRGRPRKR